MLTAKIVVSGLLGNAELSAPQGSWRALVPSFLRAIASCRGGALAAARSPTLTSVAAHSPDGMPRATHAPHLVQHGLCTSCVRELRCSTMRPCEACIHIPAWCALSSMPPLTKLPDKGVVLRQQDYLGRQVLASLRCRLSLRLDTVDGVRWDLDIDSEGDGFVSTDSEPPAKRSVEEVFGGAPFFSTSRSVYFAPEASLAGTPALLDSALNAHVLGGAGFVCRSLATGVGLLCALRHGGRWGPLCLVSAKLVHGSEDVRVYRIR